MRIGSLFSGYGGLEQGVQAVLGGTVAWHSEIDPGACKILAHRYLDVPNLGDITAVDWADVEPVDVLVGGFPCQDISAAGKRAGLRPGTRSGLWSQFAYAISQLRPPLVVIENVRNLLSVDAHCDVEPCPWCVGDDEAVLLWALGAVLGDLADIGYDASWQGLRAADVGAPHGRFRVFVTAWPAGNSDSLARSTRFAQHWGRGPLGEPGAIPGTVRPDRLPAPHPGSDALREQSVTFAGCSGSALVGLAGADAPADADRDGREGVRRLHPVGRDADGRGGADISWGQYEPAIRRWERLTRPAPAPTEMGRTGARLSPAFVEWMQGLPVGWVTDVPGLSRNEQLKALGNGVVPQQAAHAVELLLARIGWRRAA